MDSEMYRAKDALVFLAIAVLVTLSVVFGLAGLSYWDGL